MYRAQQKRLPLAILAFWLCWNSLNLFAAADETPQTIRIELGNHQILPETVQIQAETPTTVELVNNDIVAPHTFTIEDKVGNLVINYNVIAGQSVSASLPPMKAGSYTYYCNKMLPMQSTHREQGEEGTLVVLDD